MRNRLTLLNAALLAGSLFVIALVVVLHLSPMTWPIPAMQWYALRVFWSRLLVVALGVATAALLAEFREPVGRAIRTFFTTPGSPVDLAMLRIVVTLAILYSIDNFNFGWHTRLPASLIVPPQGLGWMYDWGLFNEDLALFAKKTLVLSGLFSLMGLWVRVSVPILALAFLYLMAIPHFDGKVDHAMHCLVLVICLLAVSPCGDALSLDALWKRRPRPAAALRYSLPIRFCWLLMATGYFFPGFWKLWESGLDWIISDHLKLTLHRQWLIRPHLIPLFRFDQSPVLLALGGVVTLLFELGFVFCLFSPRGRWLLILVGQAFHFSIRLTMGISFMPMQICYASFIPWSKLPLLRSRHSHAELETTMRGAWPCIGLASFLIAGNLATGFCQAKDFYPISCFPTFSTLDLAPAEFSVRLLYRDEAGQLMSSDQQMGNLKPLNAAGIRYLYKRILREPDPTTQLQMLHDLKKLMDLDEVQDVEFVEFATSIDPDSPRITSQRKIDSPHYSHWNKRSNSGHEIATQTDGDSALQ